MEELKEVIKHLQDIIDIVEIDLTEDIEKLKLVEKQLKDIDYAHSSIQLKEKETIYFEDWKEFNYFKLKNRYHSKTSFDHYSLSELLLIYNALKDNL